MITIPHCTQGDIETILKVEPMREWLREVHPTIVEIVRYMIRPLGDDVRTIERVQRVSMHIKRYADKIKREMSGEIVNAQWSDKYFTIAIPLNSQELFGTMRIEQGSMNVHLSFPHPVEFMSALAFSELQDRKLIYRELSMTLKEAAFLTWCEHMKPGLSAPFLDMIQDGEL